MLVKKKKSKYRQVGSANPIALTLNPNPPHLY